MRKPKETENYHGLLWVNEWKEKLGMLKERFEILLLFLHHVTLGHNFPSSSLQKLTVTTN